LVLVYFFFFFFFFFFSLAPLSLSFVCYVLGDFRSDILSLSLSISLSLSRLQKEESKGLMIEKRVASAFVRLFVRAFVCVYVYSEFFLIRSAPRV
jgi:hypothetical protein